MLLGLQTAHRMRRPQELKRSSEESREGRMLLVQIMTERHHTQVLIRFAPTTDKQHKDAASNFERSVSDG